MRGISRRRDAVLPGALRMSSFDETRESRQTTTLSEKAMGKGIAWGMHLVAVGDVLDVAVPLGHEDQGICREGRRRE